MFVTSSVLLGSGSLGYSGREGRFFRPPPQRNLLRRELPLSPAFWNKNLAFLEIAWGVFLIIFPFFSEREGGRFGFSRGYFHSKAIGKNPGSISVSGKLFTYLSPNPTLTLTYYQLTTVVRGGVADIDPETQPSFTITLINPLALVGD